MYKRILIANRGEIALRIIRACRELGVETVAVYSEADRGAQYLRLADEAYCIGPAPARESYLDVPRIIAAAEVGNVEAIHPGYGFLAENPDFVDVCQSCQIDFIGPPLEAMRLLGDKNQARQLAQRLGVPVVPGSDGLIEDEHQALEVAHQIGFPVLIKAAAGGGGRGMRVAANDLALKNELQQAQAEAKAAFGNPSVYLEKYLEAPRHIEVQILADRHGQVLHFFERDCTVQRRHQKVIELSPAPHLPEELRQAICQDAVKLAREAGYCSAGTMEFLVDRHGNYYFIEANTRIQVEHPVTEMVTGVDLIKWQIRVAAGEWLPWQQEQIQVCGVSFECRINAEDPQRNFQPCPGKIEEIFIPGGPGVRFDSHVHAGYVVPPHYDSMIGKLIVHQPTREEAIACMRRALDELHVAGVRTTVSLLRQVFRDGTFIHGQFDTSYLDRFLEQQGTRKT